MGYCTGQDLIDRYGEEELLQLADRDGDGVADTAVLDQVIADASAEIDGYLAVRYALPLAEVPSVLVRIACEIARYHLYEDHATETVQDRYANAVKFLKAAARGEVQLIRADGATSEETAGMPAFNEGRQVFGGGGF